MKFLLEKIKPALIVNGSIRVEAVVCNIFFKEKGTPTLIVNGGYEGIGGVRKTFSTQKNLKH